MKGPFERLKYDLRRIWECPQCGHKVRTDGSATTQFCRCGKNNTNPPVAMKLIGDGPRRLVPPVPRPVVVPEPVPVQVEPATTQIDVISVTAASIEVTTEVPPALPRETPPSQALPPEIQPPAAEPNA
jgi:hypothetical protein